MDYHLQNVQTGETVKVVPNGTLIGSAEHSTFLTAMNGPYLSALVVRYPNEWAIFGLSNDSAVTFNRKPLRAGQRARVYKGSLLAVEEERFTFISPQTEPEAESHNSADSRPVCFVYIRYPDGKEECRAVDHDLLFGRSDFCHVQLADARLSRLGALLAYDDGYWYIHNLTKKVIARNRKAVQHYATIEDGDELQIGPLVVRVELRKSAPIATPPPRLDGFEPTMKVKRPRAIPVAKPATTTDFPDATDDGTGEKPTVSNLESLREHAQRLDEWLKAHPPKRPTTSQKGGLSAWLDATRDRLKRFWLDTPETTNARSLRAAGRLEEAFNVLERAIRARSDSPDLLRELYRLYEGVGFYDLCYRPLRQIEKLSEIRESSDPWVLETLARLCERLGKQSPTMTDRAIDYWSKLEAATGTSRTREKADVLARRALREGGYAGASDDAF